MLLALAAAAGCGRAASKAPPVASLSQTPGAAAMFAPIREAWQERRIDPVPIEAFLRRYPADGAAALGKVYLAFYWMDAGQPARADGILRQLDGLAPGTTRDLATVAKARSLRLAKAPQSALDSLRPLVGKMVDDADREVFLEELALSALYAHDDYEALAYLDAWLRGVGEDDRDRVKAKIAQILETMKRSVLEQTYRTMRQRGAASGYGSDTQKLVSERLARIAVDENDAALARWLVEQSGVSARETGGDAGLELGELASSRRGIETVAGQAVGVLLPTRDRELRDEAADVVRGISWALDLPRAKGDGPRLVTREDGVDAASSRTAMEELSGEGVAVIIGGFDRASADRAAAFAEASGVPVLLLAAPSRPPSRAVVLGEAPERELTMLADALAARHVDRAAFVADTPDDEAAGKALAGRLLPAVRCDVPVVAAGKPRFPLDAWRAQGAKGWLVSGPSSCTRDLVHELGPRVPGAVVAVTLEAGVAPDTVPRGMTILSVAAGLVPAMEPEAETQAFVDRFGVRPSYWTALGRDAAALAKGALAALPKDTTSDKKLVRERRAKVEAGLLATRVRLWTTEATGLGDGRVLPRTLKVVTSRPK